MGDCPPRFTCFVPGGECRWGKLNVQWCQESSVHIKGWPSDSTLGKQVMMRSRLTVGPKGVREDLIFPESCRPNQGKES